MIAPVQTTDDCGVAAGAACDLGKPFWPGCQSGTGGGTGCIALRLSTDSGRSFGWAEVNSSSNIPPYLRGGPGPLHGVATQQWWGYNTPARGYVLDNNDAMAQFLNSTCSDSPETPCEGTRCQRYGNQGSLKHVGGRHLEYSPTQEKYSLCGLPWHNGCGDGKTKAKDSRGCASDAARSVGVAFRPRDNMMFMAISPYSDQLKFGGNSGLAVASSTNGFSWNWVSWVLHPEDVPARYNKQLEVGAGEQTVGFLSDGRMVVVSRICSCSNVKPPDTQHFKCTNSSNFCDYGVLFSLDDTGENWSGLELLAGAGSVAPSLQRFGTRLLLAGGRRGQFLWDISNGTVSAAVDLRTHHNDAVRAHNLSIDTFFQQQEPSPFPLDNGESTSYTSLLKISETKGIVVYDMLSQNWAGPPGNGRPGPAYEGGRREDHVFSMRFHVAADPVVKAKQEKG